MEYLHQPYTEAMAMPWSERKRHLERKETVERKRAEAQKQAKSRMRGRRVR